jgi:hypothetical protein
MIILPQLFSAKLAEKPTLLAAVTENFCLFDPWLEQSGMPFFPGFTDHSPRHISDVLQSAASLLSDDSHSLLSAEDVCVLCISILLHDCGMHLTQDSFRNLINNDGAPIVDAFGDRPWAQIWKEYLSEASRFGQEKLVAIFGTTDPVLIDEFQIDNLSERDCLLVGEFVRRHHTRLAHEIALEGVGRKGGTPLKLVGLDLEVRDLSGLVARSHGMSIRRTFEYLSEKYSLIPSYRGIKTPFLMAVIRIADYIQVQSERALKALLSVKELRSPISRLEWQAHFAVRDISTAHADPEALYVHALPVDAKMFLKLSALFKDIQRELDDTWATLGEVYGRNSLYAKLGLNIRRIRSNLDDVKKFSKGVAYFPIKAKFDSSGSDLLSLLVGPLYDYEYGIGIRELIQNAVDACREATDLFRSKILPSAYVAEVKVEIEESDDGTGWITVTDNGVGMTIDTIVKYYLIAGASFRNSDAWKLKHLDERGDARVVRGGRFGVGALAAFLLGDEIKVTTRYFDASESDGVEFSARIDDTQVELRRCKAAAGTSIRILVTDTAVIKKLRPFATHKKIKIGEINKIDHWAEVDWFVQSEPKISYVWNGFNNTVEENYYNEPRVRYSGVFESNPFHRIPNEIDENNGWHFLDDPNPYKSLAWSYSSVRRKGIETKTIFRTIDEVVVNGIRVESSMSSLALPKSDRFSMPVFFISRPSLSISDPAGLCPINLQRSSISFERMGVDERLARSILSNVFLEMKRNFANCSTINQFYMAVDFLMEQPGIKFPGQLSPLCICNKGVFLSSGQNLGLLGIDTVYFLDAESQELDVTISELLSDNEALILRREADSGTQSALSWFRGVFSSDATYYYSHARTIGAPDVIPIVQIGIIPNKRWSVANEKGRVSKALLHGLDCEKFDAKFKMVSSGGLQFEDALKERIAMLHERLSAVNEICMWKFKTAEFDSQVQAIISEVWETIFSGGLL